MSEYDTQNPPENPTVPVEASKDSFPWLYFVIGVIVIGGILILAFK